MTRIIAAITAVLVAVIGMTGIPGACAEGNTSLQAGQGNSTLMQVINGRVFFHVQVSFDTNKYFSRYDVRMFVDGEEVTTIPHGGFYEGVLGVSEGYHIVKFGKTDNPEGIFGTSLLKVTEDSDYTCTIHAYWSHIEIGNERQNGLAVNHKVLDQEVFIRECTEPDYETVLRYPDKLRGKKVWITGKVLKVVDIPLVGYSLMSLADGNDIWFVPFTRNQNEARILENDTITVYGEYKGLSSFYMGNGFVFGNWLAAYPTVSGRYFAR